MHASLSALYIHVSMFNVVMECSREVAIVEIWGGTVVVVTTFLFLNNMVILTNSCISSRECVGNCVVNTVCYFACRAISQGQ